jgi:hypothetical protein
MRGVSAFLKGRNSGLEKIFARISSNWNGRLEKISKISSSYLPPPLPMDMYKPQKDARFSYEHDNPAPTPSNTKVTPHAAQTL